MKKGYQQSKSFGIGMTTKLRKKIVSDFRNEEVLIDATYKTKKQKTKLFVVTEPCMGVGF